MKRMFLALIALIIILTACSEFAEPDVAALTDTLLSGQDVESPTYASETDVGIIFDIDLGIVEAYSVCYSGEGAKADMIAVFKLNNADSAESVAEMLIDYKTSRYKDFEGYAPFEAEKVENGEVMTYGRYVLLVILGDMDAAQLAADEAFLK